MPSRWKAQIYIEKQVLASFYSAVAYVGRITSVGILWVVWVYDLNRKNTVLGFRKILSAFLKTSRRITMTSSYGSLWDFPHRVPMMTSLWYFRKFSKMPTMFFRSVVHYSFDYVINPDYPRNGQEITQATALSKRNFMYRFTHHK